MFPFGSASAPCKLRSALTQEISTSLKNRFLGVGAGADSFYRRDCHEQDLIVAPCEAVMDQGITAAGQYMLVMKDYQEVIDNLYLCNIYFDIS